MARKAVKTGFQGFTLSELLIALAILGVIATFTIPKVLQSQQDGKYKAIAKEVAGMLSEAYQAYKLKNAVTAATKPIDLLPYLNYVQMNTSGSIDAHPNWAGDGGGLLSCTATNPCLKLHNGSSLRLGNGASNFGGTTALHVIYFYIDPDGIGAGGTSDGPSKSLQIQLYYNGYLTSRGLSKTGTCDFGSCVSNEPDSSFDPSWFSWN